MVRLYHPELGEHCEVPESTARMLRKRGWVDADAHTTDVLVEAVDAGRQTASEFAESLTSDPSDLNEAKFFLAAAGFDYTPPDEAA